MRLVDDDGVVGGQEPVALRFSQQNAVGHELDERIRPRPICKAHLVPHGIADGGAELLRDARRHAARCDAPRLGMSDQAAPAPPHIEADLRQLRGLARAGLATHDHHLMRRDCCRDLVAAPSHRQVGRIRNAR